MKKIYPAILALFLLAAVSCGGGGGDGDQVGEVPPVPATLSASATASDTIHLQWQYVPGPESGFHVYLLPDVVNPVKSLGPGSYESDIVGLTAEQEYQFRITAYNAVGESELSNMASAVTPPSIPVPAAPSTLAAFPFSSSEVRVIWSDNSDDEGEFRIYRGTTENTINSLVGSVEADSTAFMDTGVVTGQTYHYLARAHNAGGESASSNTDQATTYSPVGRWEYELVAYNNCPPYGPRTYGLLGWGSLTESSPRQITLHSDKGTLNGYYVPAGDRYQIILNGNLAGINFQPLLLWASTDWSDMHSGSGAINVSGCGGPVTDGIMIPIDPGAPEAPTGLVASALSSSIIALTWTDNATSETQYRVYRGTYLFGIGTLVATLDPGTESYRDEGLTASTAYVYQVVASNASGDSPRSNEDSARTFSAPTAPPIAPSGLSATPTSGTTVSLSWSDNSGDEDGFRVYRGTSSGTINILVDTLGVNTTQFQDTGLSQGTTYFYQVAAYNSFGPSVRSNWDSAFTPSNIPIPTAPSGLSASAVSETEIQLSWSDNSDNEDGFRIYEAAGSCGAAFVSLGTVSAGTTSEMITGLTQGTTACYKITAYNQGGESVFSNTASATTVSSPATLRIVNDLYNVDEGQYLWSLWNQIVYVRIGPYLDVLGAECNSVLNNNNYERLNRSYIGAEPGPAIDPGYNNAPNIFTYEDFDVSNFTSGKYCVYLQAGWWEYQVDIFGGGPGWWEIHPTASITCSGEAVPGSKWNAFYIYDHTAGTHTEYVSSWLPDFQWQGSSFCQ